MKLRNKKTGEITQVNDWDFVGLVLKVDHSEDTIEMDDKIEYHSLAELNEEWEDYKQAEPLIKDPKIRKLVRDWAEMNGINKIIVFDQSSSPYIPAGQVVFAENAGRLRICFKTDEKFDTDRIYTVPELCGEEEE